MKKQSNLSRLMDYAGNRKYLTYLSWVLSAVSALIALVPFIYIWLIIKEVLDVMPNFENATGLIYNGMMAVVFAVIAIFVYLCALMCSHISAFRVQSNLKKAIMEHILCLPLGIAESIGSGKLRKIANESTLATENYIAHQLPDKVTAIATPMGLLVLLFVFDWRLGLFSLIPVIISMAVMMLMMTGNRMKEKMKEYQNALDDMSNEAVEYVRGIPVVKTFGQSVYSFKRFKGSIDNYERWVISYTKELRFPMMLYTTAINSVFAFLIVAGMIFAGSELTNEFILNIIFYIIITPVISLTLTKIMFQSEDEMVVDDAFERIDSILNLAPLKNAKSPQSINFSDVELENVKYSYDGKKNALDGITLKIKENQTVAFVGPSGGGKTTIANIICRFFDAQEGSVKIGGVNVKSIAKDELMNNVSFVFQNSHLIKASILDNIRMGKPDATTTEVLMALEKAQCMDIIEKLPNGIDTVVGTNGVFLSGGEQQRIAIARTILKNSKIVILDEATAFADPDNEVKVQRAFNELAKNRTMIMIAHRLTTVANADCIYVVADGKIVENGTSNELIKKNGIFAKMWNEYQSSINWKITKGGKRNAKKTNA